MKLIGYIIVGFEFGTVWGDFFSRQGFVLSAREAALRIILGLLVWGVLAFV